MRPIRVRVWVRVRVGLGRFGEGLAFAVGLRELSSGHVPPTCHRNRVEGTEELWAEPLTWLSCHRQSAIRMDNMVQYNENLIAERYEDVKEIENDVSRPQSQNFAVKLLYVGDGNQ